MDHCVKLLTDRHSIDMHSRHVSYIERLAVNCRNRGGVLLSELIQLFKVIEVLVLKISDVPNYKHSLIELISLLGGALVKERTSDEQR